MRIIDADKMIADTKAMQKYIAEGITCDGIIKYLEDHSVKVSDQFETDFSNAMPCKLDEIFYYPMYHVFVNSRGERKEVSEIRELKVCSLTLKHDGTWNIMTSCKIGVQKFTVADVDTCLFRDKKEAEERLEELKNENV